MQDADLNRLQAPTRIPTDTLRETNVAPENRPLEKEIPIGNHPFFRGYVSFREGSFFWQLDLCQVQFNGVKLSSIYMTTWKPWMSKSGSTSSWDTSMQWAWVNKIWNYQPSSSKKNEIRKTILFPNSRCWGTQSLWCEASWLLWIFLWPIFLGAISQGIFTGFLRGGGCPRGGKSWFRPGRLGNLRED